MKTTRSVRASKNKLTKALYASGMKTQTQLAEKIADNEGLSAVPKNLVNKVFTGKPVDPLSLERVTTALRVETHTVLLSSDETQPDEDDVPAAEPVPAESTLPVPTAAKRRGLMLTAVALAAFLSGAALTAIFYRHFDTPIVTEQDYMLVDFEFADGDPPRGYGLFDGVLIGLDSINMELVGYSIRDTLDTNSAKVSLTFDEPINYFRLEVSYVLPPDEFLTGFNLGLPTQTTGDLVVQDDIVTSNVPGDNGAGSLIWEGINVQEVNFEIGNLAESTAYPALVIDAFGFRPIQTD